jgi:hypothetical protein
MPGDPGPSMLLKYSAAHKKVKNLGATHKSTAFSVNTGGIPQGLLNLFETLAT